MIKLLIADDVQNIRESLSEKVALFNPDATVVACADSVASTIKAISTHDPDVVLLDIEMGDGTGFDVLKQFPKPSFKVIFVTAFRDYAIEAFRFSALDYLLKPVDPEQLAKAINTAADQIDREKISLKINSFMHNMDVMSRGLKKVVLKTADNMHVVNLSDVAYCESDHSYTYFNLADKSRIMVSKNIGDYEEMFVSHNFIRVHQSFLVNIAYIKRYEKGEGGKIYLADGISLPVSTRKKEQLMQLLARL